MKQKIEKPISPWQISSQQFPEFGTAVEKWKYFLGFAVLAPSSHNSQPWQFRIHDGAIELRVDRQRACRVVDPQDRELITSCGCALKLLQIALRHYHHLGEVQILRDANDRDLIARVSFGEQGENSFEENLIFHAIAKRRTNRQPFSVDPLPEALLAALQSTAEKAGTKLGIIRDEETKYAVGDLVAEGDREQWSNKAFRQELSKWVHSNHSGSRDGIPGYAQGIDDLMSYAGPLVVRTFDMGDGQAAKDHEVATGSPALAILSTKDDSPREWIAAGQALASVLLRARVEDVWASFLNQPIEVPHLRERLRGLLGEDRLPQAILRLGFGPDTKPTPRREVEDVLV